AIDMSGQETLNIPEGVTLGSTRGVASSEGGLIFSDALDTPGLFHTAGDCVRITGLRIRGPYAERERAAHSSNGIETAHFALEIDNCEISAFAVAATRFILGASRGYVHHNYIHHNQLGGLGYGVSIGGASVLVEGNLFDWCRHHIASSGAPGSAYEARYNICGENANGHLFDMHGGRDRGDATDIAGDWMDIHHNTFMAQDVRSVGIRGIPSQGTQIHHNWFYSSDPENIVRASGKTRVFQNVLGADRTLVEEVEVTV
ncbi:MAG: right-handed parallel beta-helix repeat-containing protein, partial [bacterium]|nr:right-handed parallel beta-helix repeat-containing protein [bacterium]